MSASLSFESCFLCLVCLAAILAAISLGLGLGVAAAGTQNPRCLASALFPKVTAVAFAAKIGAAFCRCCRIGSSLGEIAPLVAHLEVFNPLMRLLPVRHCS